MEKKKTNNAWKVTDAESVQRMKAAMILRQNGVRTKDIGRMLHMDQSCIPIIDEEVTDTLAYYARLWSNVLKKFYELPKSMQMYYLGIMKKKVNNQ